MIYRRGNHDPVWHCCQNCDRWPAEDYCERTVEPPKDAVCEECIRRVEALRCEVVPEQGAS